MQDDGSNDRTGLQSHRDEQDAETQQAYEALCQNAGE